jgi:hypothetical protein
MRAAGAGTCGALGHYGIVPTPLGTTRQATQWLRPQRSPRWGRFFVALPTCSGFTSVLICGTMGYARPHPRRSSDAREELEGMKGGRLVIA